MTDAEDRALTPEQAHREAVERDHGPRYADGRPKYHRHFADYAVHTDEECEQPFGRRRVYVFDTEDLEAHEAFIVNRTRTYCTCGYVGGNEGDREVTTYKEAFIGAVNSAQRAAAGDSNDAELDALREAVQTAQGWFSTMDLISLSEYDDAGEPTGIVSERAGEVIAVSNTPKIEALAEEAERGYDVGLIRRRSLCTCRSGWANDPGVHNNQVRRYGRCSCECHGER